MVAAVCWTVVDGVTGIFLKEPSVEALVGAVRRYQSIRDGFDPELIARHARAFDKSVFIEQMKEVLQGALAAEARWRPR
jgi:glycosyltransferase involved in cell wall biosynthesis